MRPIIDDNGPRLVDDNGLVIPGIQSFTVECDMDGAMVVTNIRAVAMRDGKPIPAKYRADPCE